MLVFKHTARLTREKVGVLLFTLRLLYAEPSGM